MIKAAGAIIVSLETSRLLLNLRSDTVSNSHTWGFFGGKVEQNETVLEGLQRELAEEIGNIPPIRKILPIDVFTSRDRKFQYYSFLVVIEGEFLPYINSESDGFAWCKVGATPRPLHTGVRSILLSPQVQQNIQNLLIQLRSE